MSSTWHGVTKTRALSYVENMLTWANAAAFEARCAELIAPHIPSFIYGTEGATFDCGIIIDRVIDPQVAVADRIFYLTDEDLNRSCILPIDFKTLTASTVDNTADGIFQTYAFESSEKQRDDCSIYIISNPASHDFIAVIPHEYLQKHKDVTSDEPKKKGSHLYSTREFRVAHQTVEPFPTEWSPFVLPVWLLPALLQGLRAYVNGTSEVWENPYNNITLSTSTEFQLVSGSDLLATEANHIKDFPFISGLRSAFLANDSKYQVCSSVIRPSVGDFRIKHRESGQLISVELKRRAFTVNLNFRRCVHGRSRNQTDETSPYFSNLSHWDFLLSTSVSAPGRGNYLFIARKNLPKDWFDTGSADKVWSATDDILLNKHIFFVETLTELVPQIERILDREGSDGSSKVTSALISTPITRAYNPLFQKLRGPQQADTRALGNVRRNLAPTYHSWRRFEDSLEQKILESCAQENYGTIFRIPSHPYASHIFISGFHAALEATNFTGLSLQTPLLYLNFAQVNTLDLLVPSDAAHPGMFQQSVGRPVNSLYVMVPNIEPIEARDDLYCYLIPSTALNTPDRIAFYKVWRALDKSQRTEYERALFLKHGELLEYYGIPRNKLVTSLRRFFSEPLSTSAIPVNPWIQLHPTGNEEVDGHEMISLNDHVYSKLHCIQGYFDDKNKVDARFRDSRYGNM